MSTRQKVAVVVAVLFWAGLSLVGALAAPPEHAVYRSPSAVANGEWWACAEVPDTCTGADPDTLSWYKIVPEGLKYMHAWRGLCWSYDSAVVLPTGHKAPYLLIRRSATADGDTLPTIKLFAQWKNLAKSSGTGGTDTGYIPTAFDTMWVKAVANDSTGVWYWLHAIGDPE